MLIWSTPFDLIYIFYIILSIYSAAFVGAKVDYWCVDDLQNGANFETAKLDNISLGKDSCRSNCSKYKFDDSFWKATIIMDFDLICGDSKLATVAKMLFFTGFGTGVLVILESNFLSKTNAKISQVLII